MCKERVVVQREMSCTRAELLRWLPGAVGSASCCVDDTRIVVDLGPGEVEIHADALAPRVVGALALPRLALTFEFSSVEARRREAFLSYFDLYTRRGGG